MDWDKILPRKSLIWDTANRHRQREDAISGIIQGHGDGRYVATSGYFDTAGNLWVSGSLYLDGDVTANSIFLAGESGIYGDLEAQIHLTSGTLSTEILNASGALDTQLYSASGTLDAQIYNTSGTLRSYTDTEVSAASGSVITQLYSASGTLDTLIDTVQAEWVAGSGSLDTQFYSASGTLDTQIYGTSGFFYTSYLNQLLTTAGTPQFTRLGLNAAADATDELYVNGSVAILGDTMLGDVTDDTNKTARMIAKAYDSGTESEGWLIFQGYGATAANTLDIGGGVSARNAATLIRFWTAADNTTRTGTARFSIDNAGAAVLLGTFQASGIIISPYASITSPQTLTLTPSGHYYEITNDGGGYDLTVSLSGDAMAVGSVLYIAYISTGGGRTCTITSTGVNVLLSGGKEAASFIKTSVGWLPMPKGASTS